MTRRLTTLAMAGALAMGLSAPAFATQGVTDTEILLGDILPLTGPPALLGVAHNLGVQVAIAEANEKGGIHGRKFKLISEDDGYVPSRTIQGIRKLLDSDKVFALTSVSGTAQSQAIMPLLVRSGIPAMAPITTYAGLYEPVKKNVFAVGYDMEKVVDELVSMVADRYPGKKWAVISQDDEYGQNVRDGFARAAKEKGFEVVSNQIFKKNQTDFSSEILRVKQAGAEALMAGGVLAENVTMVKELERIGYKIPTTTTYVSRVPATMKMMGSSGENVYTVDYVYLESQPEAKEFMGKVTKYLSPEAQTKVNRYTFTGYASTRALFHAIEQCGKDLTWECTIDELNKVTNLETGAMAPITFTQTDHLAAPKLMLMKANPAETSYDVIQ